MRGGWARLRGGGPDSAGAGAGRLYFQSTQVYVGAVKISVKPSGVCLWWGGGEDSCSEGSLLGTPSGSSWDVVFGLG